MYDSINRLMEWPDKPKLKEELYKSKPVKPADTQPRVELPIVSDEVLDEVEVLRLAQALGEIAGREAAT